MPNPMYMGDNNFEFGSYQNIENELIVATIVSAHKDMYWYRPAKDVPLMPHGAGSPHPDNPYMAKDYGCHLMTDGSCDFTFTWTEEDNIPDEYARNYAHYLDTIAPEPENVLETSFGPNGHIKQYAEANGSVTTFAAFRPEYTFLVDVTLNLHKGSSLVCIARTDPEFSGVGEDNWDQGYIDVQAGQSVTLEPFGSKTYFLFGKTVQKEGQDLEAFKVYKCTRPIEVTCSEFTKIARIHRK